MDLRLLGTLKVTDDNIIHIPISAPRLRATLVALALRAGYVVPVSELVDQLWGNRPPRTASATLRNYIKQLRKLLPENRILTQSGGYLLDIDPDHIDLLRFRRLRKLAQELTESAPERAAGVLDEALALWRGTPFTDLGDVPLRMVEQARLEDLYLSTWEERFAIGLDLGAHHALIDEIKALSQTFYLRERLTQQLIVGLYRCGRTAEALAAYRSARERLMSELGIEPGIPLRQLEQAILRSDPELLESNRPGSLPGRVPQLCPSPLEGQGLHQ